MSKVYGARVSRQTICVWKFKGFVWEYSAGKRRTQNLQNADIRHSQPQGRQNTTHEVSLRLFWSIYEHSTQYFDLNMNLRIFPYKSFKFPHTDCLGALWSKSLQF